MLLVNFLTVNYKCFSLVDLLHRLHCVVISNYVISANKYGWIFTAYQSRLIASHRQRTFWGGRAAACSTMRTVNDRAGKMTFEAQIGGSCPRPPVAPCLDLKVYFNFLSTLRSAVIEGILIIMLLNCFVNTHFICAGKPSRYVTSHLNQLSRPLAEVKGCVHLCRVAGNTV